MITKKLITFFFFFTLLLQVLPVKEIGYELFSNQLNEELPDGLEENKAPAKTFAVLDDHLLFPGNTTHILSTFTRSNTYIFYSCSIPANHKEEIHTPPPNMG